MKPASLTLSLHNVKTCKICGLEKPYDKTQTKNNKSSGFYGKTCWVCHLVCTAKTRSTEEGRAKANAASALANAKVRSTPEGRAKHTAAALAWQKKYPAKANANTMKYYTAKFQRIPLWADLEAIICFYKEAYRLTLLTGILHVVDHIIPLRGRKVSGLHVENNLQIITKKANSEKGNKYHV